MNIIFSWLPLFLISYWFFFSVLISVCSVYSVVVMLAN